MSSKMQKKNFVSVDFGFIDGWLFRALSGNAIKLYLTLRRYVIRDPDNPWYRSGYLVTRLTRDKLQEITSLNKNCIAAANKELMITGCARVVYTGRSCVYILGQVAEVVDDNRNHHYLEVYWYEGADRIEQKAGEETQGENDDVTADVIDKFISNQKKKGENEVIIGTDGHKSDMTSAVTQTLTADVINKKVRNKAKNKEKAVIAEADELLSNMTSGVIIESTHSKAKDEENTAKTGDASPDSGVTSTLINNLIINNPSINNPLTKRSVTAEAEKEQHSEDGCSFTSRDLIGDLGDTFLAIPGVAPMYPTKKERREIYARIGRLYNKYDYPAVADAINAVRYMMDRTKLKDPLRYLVGILNGRVKKEKKEGGQIVDTVKDILDAQSAIYQENKNKRKEFTQEATSLVGEWYETLREKRERLRRCAGKNE